MIADGVLHAPVAWERMDVETTTGTAHGTEHVLMADGIQVLVVPNGVDKGIKKKELINFDKLFFVVRGGIEPPLQE